MINDYLNLVAAIVGFVLCFIILMIWPFDADAHDINIDNSVTNNYTNGPESSGSSSGSLDTDVSRAVATAASMAFCNFDYSPGLQGCVGTATYNDEWALNFQAGKRIDTLLLTGGFACDDEFDECAAGGAVSFRF